MNYKLQIAGRRVSNGILIISYSTMKKVESFHILARALEEENLYEEIIMCWDLGMSNNKNI